MPPRTPRPAAVSHPMPTLDRLAAAFALGSIALGASHCRPPLCFEPTTERSGPRTLRDALLERFRCEAPSTTTTPCVLPPHETEPKDGTRFADGQMMAVTPTPPPDPQHTRGARQPVSPNPPPSSPTPHLAPGHMARVGTHPIERSR